MTSAVTIPARFTVRLVHGDTLVAVGKPATPAIVAPKAPVWAVASLAAREFAGRVRERHPFPGCFACGPDRDADGLRIWPGPAGPDGLVACIPPGTKIVLGTMTARVEAPVLPGGDYIVAGWPLGSAGRMHRAGAALYERGGRRVALAESLWITPR